MTVYVDLAEINYRGMKMSHLLADTRDELFEMIDRIGVSRRWYQGFEVASCPHFDVARSKRMLAIQWGAVVVDRHELVRITQRIKQEARAKVLVGEPTGWERPAPAISLCRSEKAR